MSAISARSVYYTFFSTGTTYKKLAGCKSVQCKLTAKFDEERDKDSSTGPHREFQYCEMSGSASGVIADAGTGQFGYGDMQDWAKAGVGPACKLNINGTVACHCTAIKITGFTLGAPVEGKATWTLNFTGVGKAING